MCVHDTRPGLGGSACVGITQQFVSPRFGLIMMDMHASLHRKWKAQLQGRIGPDLFLTKVSDHPYCRIKAVLSMAMDHKAPRLRMANPS